MKEADRLMYDAEQEDRLAQSSQDAIDLRAREIDKLQQEITFYEGEVQKHSDEAARLRQMAREAADKENYEKEQRRKNMMMNAAQSASNNN